MPPTIQVGNGADIHAQEDMQVTAIILAGDGTNPAILSVYLTETAIAPAAFTLKCAATASQWFPLFGTLVPYNSLFDENGSTCIYTVIYEPVDNRPGEG